jgi:hypothetical protein
VIRPGYSSLFLFLVFGFFVFVLTLAPAHVLRAYLGPVEREEGAFFVMGLLYVLYSNLLQQEGKRGE